MEVFNSTLCTIQEREAIGTTLVHRRAGVQQKDHQHLGCFLLLLLLVTQNPNPGARISELQGMTAAAPPADWSSTKSATHPIHKTPKWSPPPPSSFLFLKLQRHAHSEPYFNFTNACILTTKCTPLSCRQILWELTELERNPTAKSNKLITFFKHSFPFLSFLHKGREKSQSNRSFKHGT